MDTYAFPNPERIYTHKLNVVVLSKNIDDFQEFVNGYLQTNEILYRYVRSRKVETYTTAYYCVSKTIHYCSITPDRIVETPRANQNEKYFDLIQMTKYYLPIGKKIEYEL